MAVNILMKLSFGIHVPKSCKTSQNVLYLHEKKNCFKYEGITGEDRNLVIFKHTLMNYHSMASFRRNDFPDMLFVDRFIIKNNQITLSPVFHLHT